MSHSVLWLSKDDEMLILFIVTGFVELEVITGNLFRVIINPIMEIRVFPRPADEMRVMGFDTQFERKTNKIFNG